MRGFGNASKLNARAVTGGALLLSLLLLPAVSTADQGPPAHRAIFEWLARRQAGLGCAGGDGDQCAWPGSLHLEVDRNGGEMTINGWTDSALMLPLPGGGAHWPTAVRVNGRPAVVLSRDHRPAVTLAKGEWEISGRFDWTEVPDRLPVPPSYGAIAVTREGEPPVAMTPTEGGELTLMDRVAADAPERLDVKVFRKIADGVPPRIETRLMLMAGGSARDVDLGRVEIGGTRILNLSADTAVRFDDRGHLIAFVPPGDHLIEVSLIAGATQLAFDAGDPGGNRPVQEVWTVESSPGLRQLKVDGAPAIDGGLAELPEAWRELPAYLLHRGETLTLTPTKPRADEEPRDALEIDRTIIFDEGAAAFIISDNITGTLRHQGRLDLAAAGELGGVTVSSYQPEGEGDKVGDRFLTQYRDYASERQLITTNPESGLPGVEIRDAWVDVTAEWRRPAGMLSLPVSGWTGDVARTYGAVVLPRGWRLLWMGGVDRSFNSWWRHWTPTALVLLVVIGWAMGRLTRWYLGAALAAAMVLGYSEVGTPYALWLLPLAALWGLRAAKRPRRVKAARVGFYMTFGFVLLALIAFAASQLELVLSDGGRQRGSGHFYERFSERHLLDLWSYSDDNLGLRALESAAPDSRASAFGLADGHVTAGGGDIVEARQRLAEKEKSAGTGDRFSPLRYRTGEVIPVGFGAPERPSPLVKFGCFGPITPDREMTLYLIPPWVTRLIRLLVLALFGLSAAALARAARCVAARPMPGEPGDTDSKCGISKAAAATGALAMLAVSTAPRSAAALTNADVIPIILEDLEREPLCGEECIGTDSLRLRLEGRSLVVDAEVHAGALTGWPLPGPASSWRPARVTVDGRATRAMAVRDDGLLYVRLTPGIHRVRATGPVGEETFSLEMGVPPRDVEVETAGWRCQGLREDGAVPERLVFVPEEAGDEPAKSEGTVHFDPWLEVERTVEIGLDWRVRTVVRRLGDTDNPLFADLPLLAGEQIIDGEIEVEEDRARIPFAPGEATVRFQSLLTPAPKIRLTAPVAAAVTEVWRLRCGVLWQCRASGLAPVRRAEAGWQQQLFRPWPGDSLVIRLTRPKSAGGPAELIWRAEMMVNASERRTTTHLKLEVARAEAGTHEIALPEGAEVLSLAVDGEETPFALEDAVVRLPLGPGEKAVTLAWREPREGGIVHETPAVNLGSPAVNLTVSFKKPRSYDWWVLFTLGPHGLRDFDFWLALLFWLIAGALIGRIRGLLLTRADWMLLAFGFALLPVFVPPLFVAWTLARRGVQRGPREPPTRLGDGIRWAKRLALVGSGLALLVILLGALWRTLGYQLPGGDINDVAWSLERTAGEVPSFTVVSLPRPAWLAAAIAWILALLWRARAWIRRLRPGTAASEASSI